jgi:HEAT repeat protein
LLFLLYPWLFRRAYRKFLRECLNSSDESLVLNAVQALGERDEAELAPELIALLDRSEGLNLKRNIILSLGRMRSKAALPRLIQQFHQAQESLQLAVVEALGNYRDYPGLLALYELMKSQENVSFQVRMSATRLLASIVGSRMLPLLTESLADKNPRLQANAIESLALLRSPEIVPLVLPFLESPHRRLRANAAVALFPYRAHRGQALKTIGELFASSDPLTRLGAIYAVGELSLRHFIPALEGLRKNADPQTERALVAALAKMGVRKYSAEFARYLNAGEEVIALESLQRLARFHQASRWRVFEILSRWETAAQRRIVQRLSHSPFDFTLEISWLTQRRDLMFLQKR